MSSSNSIPTEIPQPDPAAAAFTINYGVSLAIAALLLLISSLTFLSYYCTRSTPSPTTHLNSPTSPPPPSSLSRGGGGGGCGIDEATLSRYPRLLYSKAKLERKADGEESTFSSCWACCSICLADYKDAETLRMLPECGHLFHVNCIDAWLWLHKSVALIVSHGCPVCRSSPKTMEMGSVLQPAGGSGVGSWRRCSGQPW